MRTPPAIVGLGIVSAAGIGADETLEAIRANQPRLRDVPEYAEGPYMTSRVGALPEGAWERLGCEGSSRVYAAADAAVRQAIAQAAPQLKDIPADRIGLVLSTTKAEVAALDAFVAGTPASENASRHILASEVAADLMASNHFGGPVQCVSVACISGLLAIQQGARLILSSDVDAVVVVGVDVLSHFVVAGFSTLMSLDPNGCRPFDKDRHGLSLGEGAAAMVLCRADLASAPLATVAGWGSSNDANHLTGPSRDGSGLALALQRALRMAGWSPEQIEYVNAHGTGTAYNDRMEALALETVFGEHAPPVSTCKGILGHTLGAAGVIESVICVLAARSGIMPGTPGFAVPDDEAAPRIVQNAQCGVSFSRILKMNSGFGGTNGAIVLEVEAREE
ncbi:MAG: beta-ketoacyl-[acyl-carrier-protein] synthase family protein [Verrucomicrobia bacterium]|nr:beta-ketoacyl-[acyl-carrier-protein] synthase family protein [Verrucomicrobiota bacterium]